MVSQGLIQLEEQDKATKPSEEPVCVPRTGDAAIAGSDMGE